MTVCMCFVFEVLLLVDMSLLVLSGPQPTLSLKLLFCFRSDEPSPFCPDASHGLARVFSLPADSIFPQPYREFFIISKIVMGGDSWVFSLLAINIILLSFAPLTFWTPGSRAACSRCFPIPGGKLPRHLQLLTLVLADSTAVTGLPQSIPRYLELNVFVVVPRYPSGTSYTF